MKEKLVLAARILLGLMFTVFGANGLLMALNGHGFIPMPAPPAHMVPIMTGFMALKYMMPLVAFIQFSTGLLLLSGFYMNLALTLLGPVVVNIVAIHVFVDRPGLPMAGVVLLLWGGLVWSRCEDLKVLFKK